MKTFKYNIRHKGLRLLPFYLFTFSRLLLVGRRHDETEHRPDKGS